MCNYVQLDSFDTETVSGLQALLDPFQAVSNDLMRATALAFGPRCPTMQ